MARAASIIDAAEKVAAYRLRQRDLGLGETEALRIIRGGLLEYFKNKVQRSGTLAHAK